MNTAIAKIGHVHFRVRNLDRACNFYTTLLGLSVTERVGRYVFLSYGNEHHDIALHEAVSEAPEPVSGSIGLYHFAIEVTDIEDFKTFHRRLLSANVTVRAVDHGISKALYFKDPDQNGVEVYIDTRIEGGRTEWGERSTPIDVTYLKDN